MDMEKFYWDKCGSQVRLRRPELLKRWAGREKSPRRRLSLGNDSLLSYFRELPA